MNFLPILSLLLVTAYAGEIDFQSIIDKVNSGPANWKAGHNFDSKTRIAHLKKLLGAKPSPKKLPIKEKHLLSNLAIPKDFDSRKQWPHCPTISSILEQSKCRSCWAVAAASAFSDRYCIATQGNFTLPLSAEELLSCCDDCGYGCDGGFSEGAWQYFRRRGIVTGGGYNSNVGCQPYSIPPCRSLNSCTNLTSTPACERKCTNAGYDQSFRSDHRRTKDSYSLEQDEYEIMKEILLRGPVEATFSVYADFYAYKSGVYHHVTGEYLGGHAARVIGWGVENGTPYWLIANSWSERWGDKGLFKMLRGKNECGIDEGMIAGVPDV